jgi:hypothetical protein
MSEIESIPGVFIIESLQLDNEKDQLFEGKIIANILNLSKVRNTYYYIRTLKEFKKILGLFRDSKYRYLHISCHGSDGGIALTFDDIKYTALGDILQPYLFDKRLFLSACASVNNESAVAIIPKGQCYSFIGPVKNIEFRDAAIVWASFYHLMFKANATKMVRDDLIKNIQKIVNAFEQPMNYFSRSKTKKVKTKIINVQETKTIINEADQLS